MGTTRVVSLFCGVGGSDAGLYDAAAELGVKVEVVAAYDSWPKAVAVYNANLPHPVAQVCDLKTLQRADLPPHDLIIGGPPCQDHSMAGKRACKCNVGGPAAERCCLADFVRLAGDSPYIMENVVPRLINAPFSVKLCAADYGDVTSRKRWFYSNYLLHVIPTPGPRRIRDIRDHAEDERVLKKRGYWTGDELQAVVDDDGMLPTVTATDFHGTKNNGSVNPTKGSKIACKAGAHGHYDSLDSLDSLSSHSWHGHDIRGSGKLLLVTHRPRTNTQGCEPYPTVAHDDEIFGSMTADVPRAYAGETLRLGLRGNSAQVDIVERRRFSDDSEEVRGDGEIFGSITANAHNKSNPQVLSSRIVACRNPSLLEIQRAHSFPDDFDWLNMTKTDRGKAIANSWPRGMAKAVCRAMLIAMGATERAA